MFEKRIKSEYLKLAKIVYGGDFYFELDNYRLKEVEFLNSKIKKTVDSLLIKKGISEFYSYKNEETGFCANLFENIKTNELVIAYRGTERIGLGENTSDMSALLKDMATDVNLMTGAFDEQFNNAWEFYKVVKQQNPERKIVITGQSLGGALAQIVASKEYTINRKKVETYTFNAPGCFNLLDLYGCNTTFKYHFVTNYSVMNDWCGMFGLHIGKTYLIRPVKLNKIETDSVIDILNNILLTTHEDIFYYSEKRNGKVIRKPEQFNQKEGLSLWYFDENNPINKYKNIKDFIGVYLPQLNFTKTEPDSSEIIQKTEKPVKENSFESMQNSNVVAAIKNIADTVVKMQNEQREKIINSINNNIFTIAIKALDSVFSELTYDNLENAKQILSKLKITR